MDDSFFEALAGLGIVSTIPEPSDRAPSVAPTAIGMAKPAYGPVEWTKGASESVGAPALVPYVCHCWRPARKKGAPAVFRDFDVYWRGEGSPSEKECRRAEPALRGWRFLSVKPWRAGAREVPKGFGPPGEASFPPEPARDGVQWVIRLTRGAAPHKRRVLLIRAPTRPTLDEARAAVRDARLVGWRVACILSPAEHKGLGFVEPPPMYG